MGKMDVILLLPLLGVNHLQPIIYMYKRLVYLYTTDKKIIQFAIGYMIDTPLHINKVFIEQAEKFLRSTFHPNIMENIRDVMIKKDTCVIELIMFYVI